MEKKMLTLLALAVFTAFSSYAAKPSLHANVNDTIIVNNPRQVTVITGDSLQTLRIEGTQEDSTFRYENTIQIVDSNYVSDITVNGDQWDFSWPIGRKRNDEFYENVVTSHLGLGWCNAMNATDQDLDVSMGSSWEIFWTIAQWDYTPKGSRNTWSAGIGVDWRNYRMTGNQRFLKAADNNVVLAGYPEGARPKFSRVKVFSLQFSALYSYRIGKDFSVQVGPLLNLNLHSSLKTRYKYDGEKIKDTVNGARVTPVTVDFMLVADTPFVPFYVKYSPCNVLKTNHAPKFQSLSLGIYL